MTISRKDQCSWITATKGGAHEAEHCQRSAGWRMVKDDDGNMVRKYNGFCHLHQAMADEQAAREEAENDE